MAFRDGVHLHARVLPSVLNTRLALAAPSIDAVRARIATRIASRVADPDAAGLITALAVGLTDGMSTDQWRVFNATGTTHLVAISGMHVTLFALLAFAAARRLWRLLPGRALEREPFALLAGIAAAGGYALLAGFSVPTQRTWLMLAVFAGARLGARPLDAARTWSLALILVLLLDPRAPLAAGFWLSFVAVGVIATVLLVRNWFVSEKGRRVWETFLLKSPIVGPLTAQFAMARFCRMLGTLLGAGVPLIQGLNVSRRSIGNQILVDAVEQSIQAVQQGGRLGQSLAECKGLFPSSALEMISVAEESGKLDVELVRIANVTESDLDRHLKTAVAFAEPAMLFFIAVFIGIIFIGMLLPVLTMSEHIK